MPGVPAHRRGRHRRQISDALATTLAVVAVLMAVALIILAAFLYLPRPVSGPAPLTPVPPAVFFG